MGIDYGTSASKIVIRDFQAPGGERAVVLDWGGTPRIPSTVAVDAGYVLFGDTALDLRHRLVGVGLDPSRHVFESVKMRVPDEIRMGEGHKRAFAGPAAASPGDWSFVDLGTLSVWWLMCLGGALATKLAGGAACKLGATIGIPMAFYQQHIIRNAFVDIARVAWRLFRDNGPILKGFLLAKSARAQLEAAREKVFGREFDDADIGEWLRSEAEAAMLGAYRSPAVPAGPYVKVDVGAGTTNTSLFRIVEDGTHSRAGMVFFAAHSADAGMDLVDQELARYVGLPAERWYELRGREHELLCDRGAAEACAESLDTILYSGRNPAWRHAYERYRGLEHEREAWRNSGVFLLGGGERIGVLGNRLLRYPMDPDHVLSAVPLGWPADLQYQPSGGVEQLRFLHVAYGLSVLDGDIPFVDLGGLAGPVRPQPHYRPRRDHEDIYG